MSNDNHFVVLHGGETARIIRLSQIRCFFVWPRRMVRLIDGTSLDLTVKSFDETKKAHADWQNQARGERERLGARLRADAIGTPRATHYASKDTDAFILEPAPC